MKKYFYLFESAFLGHRYHGWQKQTDGFKTVQQQIDRQLKYLLEENKFKTLPASRTDKMVSARKHYFQLYAEQPVDQNLPDKLNKFLPDDIEILKMTEVSEDFQIIGHVEFKEYHYYFANTLKKYPMASPFMTFIKEPLDIQLMQEACREFIGEHNFKAFCYRPHPDKQFIRSVDQCKIVKNDIYQANFFPPESYVLKVKGKGFFRHQIRLMAGTLFKIGLGEISKEDLIRSLQEGSDLSGYVAPPQGLQLFDCHINPL